MSPTLAAAVTATAPRPHVQGKYLYRGDEKLDLRGVTYGPFAPGPDGEPYDPEATERDFARIAECGLNAVRVYTLPPRWLLDAAARHGLLVLAGLAWEQHVAFLSERGGGRRLARRAAAPVAGVAGHPALLGWAIGNEIPAGVVRWHGARKVRRFLSGLAAEVRRHDPGALVTYVSYPTTEYLEPEGLDLCCFNVFLEDPEKYAAYLDRLQNLAGDLPLLLTEVGLDSGTHGEDGQARSLDWQLRGARRAGCAGAFVFSWTDEWHRGGQDIDDWHFGLTDRARHPKPALEAVTSAFAAPPTPTTTSVTVVVCTYNGARTLGETCAALTRVDYPDLEVIVVDDGSSDASAEIARAHGFRVISTENRGLSCARNTGLAAATGEIVAYLDDDACPDPDWVTQLADAFTRGGDAVVAAGGPNVPVIGDGLVADAVALAPGNPTHVLLDDRVAEHVPGCNCAFRRDALTAIGGFDERFRIAGDDVDVCWRLQDGGGTVAFSPGALVFHHRRGTVGGYLRQQRNYGRAEAMLERKWPERYSAGGHVDWQGRLYGGGLGRRPGGGLGWRVYHGFWGSAPFQQLYAPRRELVTSALLMPEAYLAIGVLALLVALGALWPALLLFAPLLALAAGGLAARALSIALRGRLPTPGLTPAEDVARRGLVAVLHLVQPLVRLQGRIAGGLTPWRRHGGAGLALPVPREREAWSEEWADPVDRVRATELRLTGAGALVRCGGDFDAWDLEVRGGTLAGVRIATLVEEHGQGRQLVRRALRPVLSRVALGLAALLAVLAVVAGADGAAGAAVVLGLAAAALAARTLHEAAAAMAVALEASARP